MRQSPNYRARMTATLVLLPSPLLGPSVWRPVARALTERGIRVLSPGAPSGSPPQTTSDVLQAMAAPLSSDHDLVLVPHSNAGCYVPALCGQRRVVGAVFVDAVLPPQQGRLPVAPPELLDLLRPLVDDTGVLPPWTQWWDESDLAGLFPSDEVRRLTEREQPRLPLSYFGESLPVVAGWDDRPGAYLAFGDTYAAERREAAARGWPVVTLPGRHLHMLTDPDDVATQIIDLTTTMGVVS